MKHENQAEVNLNSRRKFIKTSIAGAAAVSIPLSVTASEAAPRASGTKPQTSGLRKRKNVMALTDQEKADFTNGILQLKRTPSPFFKNNMLSYYDSLVRIHQLAVIQSRKQGYGVGHKCPSLLTFHRKLVLLLEDALRTVTQKDITVPYWDWTDPDSVSKVFADDFMGCQIGDDSDNYAVTSGPFKKGDYELNLITVPDGDGDYLNFCPFHFLTRGPGEGNSVLPGMMANLSLPTQADVDNAMAVGVYDAAPFNPLVAKEGSFRNYLGGWKGPMGAPTLHNVVHSWTGGSWDSTSYRFYPVKVITKAATDTTAEESIGPGWASSARSYVGTMQALQTSANDPVFFIHHANVDRIWAEWQAKDGNGGRDGYVKQGTAGLEEGWGPDDDIPPYAEHKDIAEMMVTGITNASMLDISALNYEYV